MIVENVYYCVKSKEALTNERRPPIQLSLSRTEYEVGNVKKPRMINKNERICFLQTRLYKKKCKCAFPSKC